MNFALDSRLEQDSIFLSNLSLCQLRLMNRAAFSWLLLIPQRESIKEILDLTPADQQLLWQEITQAAAILKQAFTPDKINIAMLGNQVPQLHVHLIARYKTDPAWPNPVWGHPSPLYTKAELEKVQTQLLKHLPQANPTS
jgi:diadenosine tetraphosphate (Ap4A) HIT family hydrolase